MIKKLQRKFVLIAMSSLVLLIIVIIGSINTYNFYNTNNVADSILAILAEHEGSFPKFDKYETPGPNPHWDYKMTEETTYETRFFTVRIAAGSNDMEVDVTNIAAVTADEAKQYADDVLSSGKTTGYKGVYRFLAAEKTGYTLIIFLDRHLQIQSSRIFLLSSCFIALLSILIMFILLSVLSKHAIAPMIESIEKQKQFITDAGHEIKTPLTIISANTEVLELCHGKSEWTESIRKQTERLDSLIKHLLTLAKMEEENIQMSFINFSMSDLVYQATAPFELVAKMQGKLLVMDIQPNLTVHGDEAAIYQLISILVDNAVKYASEQGKINIFLRKQGKSVLLEVHNTCDMIPEKNLNRLFDRFYRADSSRSRESGGYGIGLSIAKAIVQAHKGKISVYRSHTQQICFAVLF